MARNQSTHRIDLFLTVVHAVSLALGAGAIVATGVAAAVAFPTMRDLDPALAEFSSVDNHWMIAAGSVMIRVFSAAITITGVCIGVGVVSFVAILLRIRGRRSGWTALRGVAMLILIVIFVHFAGFVLPRMNEAFEDFKQAAIAGEVDRAEESRAAFSDDHPIASREMGAIAALALASSLLAAAPLASRRRRR